MAHSLARFAGQLSEDYVWLEEQPTPAIEALYADSFATAKLNNIWSIFTPKKKKKKKGTAV